MWLFYIVATYEARSGVPRTPLGPPGCQRRRWWKIDTSSSFSSRVVSVPFALFYFCCCFLFHICVVFSPANPASQHNFRPLVDIEATAFPDLFTSCLGCVNFSLDNHPLSHIPVWPCFPDQALTDTLGKWDCHSSWAYSGPVITLHIFTSSIQDYFWELWTEIISPLLYLV